MTTRSEPRWRPADGPAVQPVGRGTPAASRAPTRDLQTLISTAVGRLRQTTGARRVVAWSLREDGSPYVAAAAFDGDPPSAPSVADLAEMATLAPVGRLDSSPALRAIARRHGLSAAAVIRAGDGTPAAVLLLGPDAVRPRTLAALDGAARRLAGPHLAALAAARLAQLDDEVRRLDRLAAMGELTAEIAHELRNPLVSMKTFLQLLPERRDDREFMEQFLGLVTDELRRMERLLDVVIEHVRPTSRDADRSGGEIADALESTLMLLRHRAHRREVALEGDAPADLPRVSLGDDGLRQVVLNLILNAIEATPAGGGVEVRARRHGESVEICIADRGSGIPAELREEIFEPFYSTRAERTGGLGLSITRRIVADAGGTIAARDREGGGAELVVLLPVV